MKILITSTEGVHVMTLFYPMRLGEALDGWKAVHPDAFISYREMSDDEIPDDRSMRDAWRDGGDQIVVGE